MHVIEAVGMWVKHLIATVGLPGLFGGMFGQAIGVPLPSELMLAFSGFLAWEGRFPFWGVIVAGAGGDTLGACLAYFIGYHGGRPLLERFGRYFFIAQRELQAADKWFDRFGRRAVLICKLLPGIRAFGSYPAGVTRMDFWVFLGYTSIGTLAWALIFGGLGFHLGKHWDVVGQYLRPITIGLIVVALITAAAWLIIRARSYRHLTVPEASPEDRLRPGNEPVRGGMD